MAASTGALIAIGVFALAGGAPSPQPGLQSGAGNPPALVAQAAILAAEFDSEGAIPLLDAAASQGDANARVALLYLRGLLAARAAFREGGSSDALKPVQESMAALGGIAQGRAGAAEIARLTLQAAAAAAQSERDEMRLYLQAATQMETVQIAAGLNGAPLLSASEIAGDLWLQVSRFDEARRAYDLARDRVGPTLRVLSGLARVARRTNDTPSSCAAYRRLLDAWSTRLAMPVEIEEARMYLDGCPR